jgi:hypothetical protein
LLCGWTLLVHCLHKHIHHNRQLNLPELRASFTLFVLV